MKTVAKIFNWITIIFTSIFLLLLLVLAVIMALRFNDSTNITDLLLALFFVLLYGVLLLIPLIVCLISNKYIKKAKCRKDIKVIGVITLLFGNLISVICILLLDDQDFIY